MVRGLEREPSVVSALIRFHVFYVGFDYEVFL